MGQVLSAALGVARATAPSNERIGQGIRPGNGRLQPPHGRFRHRQCPQSNRPRPPRPKSRLEAIPWTRFTVQAQAQLERDGALRQRRLGALGTVDAVGVTEVEGEGEEEAEEKPKEKE